MQITTTEGSPDAEVKIRVRGGGSITGDNTPLFVVDGFPVTSISDIAPSDIESIDVLKDASSTFFGNYQDIDIYDNIAGNDWQTQTFGRVGFTFNHNLSISGGTDKTRYSFSYNHISDKAIMQQSDFQVLSPSKMRQNCRHKDIRIP